MSCWVGQKNAEVFGMDKVYCLRKHGIIATGQKNMDLAALVVLAFLESRGFRGIGSQISIFVIRGDGRLVKKLEKFAKNKKGMILERDRGKEQTVVFASAQMLPFLFNMVKNYKRISVMEAAGYILRANGQISG